MACTMVRCGCGMQFQVGARTQAGKMRCPMCDRELNLAECKAVEEDPQARFVQRVSFGVGIVSLLGIVVLGVLIAPKLWAEITDPGQPVVAEDAPSQPVESQSPQPSPINRTENSERLDVHMLPLASMSSAGDTSPQDAKSGTSISRAKLQVELRKTKTGK